MKEVCGVCGTSVPYSVTAHVIINPADGEVRDAYVCRSCYEANFEGLFVEEE